jgi:hypothetical protein
MLASYELGLMYEKRGDAKSKQIPTRPWLEEIGD